jgi:hypothetical protein
MVSWLARSDIISDTWMWKVQLVKTTGEIKNSRIKLASEKYAVSLSMTIQELLLATREDAI